MHNEPCQFCTCAGKVLLTHCHLGQWMACRHHHLLSWYWRPLLHHIPAAVGDVKTPVCLLKFFDRVYLLRASFIFEVILPLSNFVFALQHYLLKYYRQRIISHMEEVAHWACMDGQAHCHSIVLCTMNWLLHMFGLQHKFSLEYCCPSGKATNASLCFPMLVAFGHILEAFSYAPGFMALYV